MPGAKSNTAERKYMNKNKIIAGSLACILSLGAFLGTGVTATAERDIEPYAISEGSVIRNRSERILALNAVKSKNVGDYIGYTVSVKGTTLSVKALRINNSYYIPSRAAANAIGASYSYDKSSGTSVMRLAGLTVSFTNGNYAAMANDRPLFSMNPSVIMSDGRMYIPAEIFAKATGLTLSVGEGISFTGNVKPLAHASKFYREDEVFWLARIIQAESGGEPLLGKIAVGNVVLNRVRSAYYPNTIYGVIFDRKYGVQFSPILNGTIYNTPSYAAVLAAKICLEGFDLSEGAFFFLCPELSSSSWIPDSREYVFSVGKHDFYK